MVKTPALHYHSNRTTPEPITPRMAMNTGSRFVVIVAGMHRSGTSVLTNVLSLLGADLPLRLMRAHESNPHGHFEPEAIVALHDQALAAAGSSWFDWRRLSGEWFRSDECEQLKQQLIAAFHADFGESRFSVLKDPRLCRLVPVWEDILDRMNLRRYYVLAYRNPIEVVQSLVRRNRIEPYRGHVLWLRNLLDAEYATRLQPRIFLRYEDLLTDPRSTLERLVAGSPMPWPRDLAQALPEIELAIRPELRRNQAREDGLGNRAEVPALVHQTFECYRLLQRDPANQTVWSRLDAIRASFDVAAETATATSEAANVVNTQAEKQRGRDDNLQLLNFRLREILAANPSELSIVPADSEVSAANVAWLNRQVRQKSARVGYLYAVLADNTAALRESHKLLAQQVQEIEKAAAQLAASTDENNRLQRLLPQSEADAAGLRADRLLAIEKFAVEIDAVRNSFVNSTSWRVTAPLRWLRQRFAGSARVGHAGPPNPSNE